MAVIKKEAYFNSTDGVSKIRTLIWQDDKAAPIGIFQLVHGVSEHIGRYDGIAEFLVSCGFVVCGNDHIGHGKSAIDGRLGEFGEEDTHIRMVDDMHVLHNIMVKRYPGLPYFMLGHSMGSFLARIYAADFGDELEGAIFCGTAHFGGGLDKLDIPLDMIIDAIGRDKRSDAAGTLLGKVTAKIYGEDDINSWLTISQANRDRYDDDPFCNCEMSMGSSMTLTRLALKCSSKESIAKTPSYLPVMLISGGKDPIGMFGRMVLKAADAYEKNGNSVEMILYPGLRHEILNEDDSSKVFEDIRKWVFNILNK